MPQSVPFQVFSPKNRVIFSGENTLQIQLRAILQHPLYLVIISSSLTSFTILQQIRPHDAKLDFSNYVDSYSLLLQVLY